MSVYKHFFCANSSGHMMFVFSLSFKHICSLFFGNLYILSFYDVCTSFFLKPTSWVSIPTPLPLSSFNQRAWHQPSNISPPPPRLLFFSRQPTQSFLLPSLLSLFIPMNAQSPVQPGLSWGVGFRGHTPTPHLQKNKRPSKGVIKTELTMETEANPTWLGQKARTLKPA